MAGMIRFRRHRRGYLFEHGRDWWFVSNRSLFGRRDHRTPTWRVERNGKHVTRTATLGNARDFIRGYYAARGYRWPE